MTEEEKEHAEFMAHGVRTVTEIVYPCGTVYPIKVPVVVILDDEK